MAPLNGKQIYMGILIELGVFALVLGFAIWQWRDLRLAREARERAQAAQAARAAPSTQEHEASGADRPRDAHRPGAPGGST